MSEEYRIRFAGLMEEYLNIPAFVCEMIEKQLKDNKYKEVIEYVIQRRNEIENKEDYLTEQEKINKHLDLQQKVEQLENIRKEAIDWINENKRLSMFADCREPEEDWNYDLECNANDLLNILNKGSESNVKDKR